MPWWGVLLCVAGSVAAGTALGVLAVVGYIKYCFDYLTGVSDD